MRADIAWEELRLEELRLERESLSAPAHALHVSVRELSESCQRAVNILKSLWHRLNHTASTKSHAHSSSLYTRFVGLVIGLVSTLVTGLSNTIEHYRPMRADIAWEELRLVFLRHPHFAVRVFKI